MSTGFSNYKCICGGNISEEWDNSETVIICDKCKYPYPKDLSQEDMSDYCNYLKGQNIQIQLTGHIHNNELDKNSIDVLINVDFLDEERKLRYSDDTAGFVSVFFSEDKDDSPVVSYVEGGVDNSKCPFTDEEKELISVYARNFLDK